MPTCEPKKGHSVAMAGAGGVNWRMEVRPWVEASDPSSGLSFLISQIRLTHQMCPNSLQERSSLQSTFLLLDISFPTCKMGNCATGRLGGQMGGVVLGLTPLLCIS
jgi:hypothetical protein